MSSGKKCPICGSDDGCGPTGSYTGLQPLSADDWRRIYEFQRYVALPFLHNIVAKSWEREQKRRKREMVIIYDDPPKGWTP